MWQPLATVLLVVLTAALLVTGPATSTAAAAQPSVTDCNYATGDTTTDQRSMNRYASSINRDLHGQTALMDLFTADGADPDAYVPVWGRGQTLGILGDVTPNPDLHNEFPAVGPVTARSFNGTEEVTGTVNIAAQGDHGDVVYRYSVPGALGTRGSTEVHQWPSIDRFAKEWMDLRLGYGSNWFAHTHDAADVFTRSIVLTHASLELERFVDDADRLIVHAAGNSGLDGEYVHSRARMYNGITVGTSPRTWLGSVHSSSGTPDGRLKPDLVVSNGNAFTSFSAPMVAATVLRLNEAAICQYGPDSDALRSETMKAIILAGTDQTRAFDGTDYTWDRTETRPLDPEFGAGTYDIFASWNILSAGEQAPTILPTERFDPAAGLPAIDAGEMGWDHMPALPGQSDAVFTIPGNRSEFTLATTWPLEVNDALDSSTLANVDVKILAWEADCTTTEVQASRSTVDNVEFLRLAEELPAERYTVVLSNLSDTPAEVGLAWASEQSASAPAPAPACATQTYANTTATITSPEDGATLVASPARFEWFDAQADEYRLEVGSNAGANDYFDGSFTEAQTVPVLDLPRDGSPVHARLSTRHGATWTTSDHVYAAGTTPVAPPPQPTSVNDAPDLVTPSPGSTVDSTSVTFTWTDEEADSYLISVGSTQGGTQFGFEYGTDLSKTFDNLPADGSLLHIRIYAAYPGITSPFKDFTVRAVGADTPAVLTAPVDGSALTSTQALFEWPDVGANFYLLYVGTSPGSSDIASWDSENKPDPTQALISDLPSDGSAVYATLYTFRDGATLSSSATYTSWTKPAETPLLLSPTPGSTLPGASADFTWADVGAANYAVAVGSAPGQGTYGFTYTSDLSTTFDFLPTSGNDIWITIWTVTPGQPTFSDSWQFTAAGG